MNVIIDNTTPPTSGSRTPSSGTPEKPGAGGSGRLPRWAPWLVMAVSAAVGLLGNLLADLDVARAVLLGVVIYLVAMPLWAASVEGSRAAKDRLATALVWCAFAVACIPLVWLLFTVVKNGYQAITPEFLNYSMRGVSTKDDVGGLYHALIGTILVTLAAAAISVPIGVFTAIYMVEYANKSKMSRVVTFLVDVMTGIPSIVAGLFALSLMMLLFDAETRMGLGASIALSLLMIPTVVRSTEEMLRLVPNDLREASYALGVPKWRTIVKVVLPTALGGIVTGIVLATSRVIGETAPILLVAGVAEGVNFNLTDGRMMTLPVYIYTQYASGTNNNNGELYAWGGALVLIVLVMVLNLIARIIGKIFAPKTGR